jgi:hypothetical protein
MFEDIIGSVRPLLDQALSASFAASAFWTGLGFFTGAIAAARLNRKNIARSHNFAAISELTQSSSQAAAYSNVLRVMSEHKASEVPLCKIKKDRALEEHALVLLGTYQFLAVATDKGFIDRKLVRDQFVPSMRTTVTKLGGLIEEYRKELERPLIWSELRSFVRRDGYKFAMVAWIIRPLAAAKRCIKSILWFKD